MSFSGEIKDSWLKSVGWGEDGGTPEWHTSMSGYQARTCYFRKDFLANESFEKEGCTLIGNS